MNRNVKRRGDIYDDTPVHDPSWKYFNDLVDAKRGTYYDEEEYEGISIETKNSVGYSISQFKHSVENFLEDVNQVYKNSSSALQFWEFLNESEDVEEPVISSISDLYQVVGEQYMKLKYNARLLGHRNKKHIKMFMSDFDEKYEMIKEAYEIMLNADDEDEANYEQFVIWIAIDCPKLESWISDDVEVMTPQYTESIFHEIKTLYKDLEQIFDIIQNFNIQALANKITDYWHRTPPTNEFTFGTLSTKNFESCYQTLVNFANDGITDREHCKVLWKILKQFENNIKRCIAVFYQKRFELDAITVAEQRKNVINVIKNENLIDFSDSEVALSVANDLLWSLADYAVKIGYIPLQIWLRMIMNDFVQVARIICLFYRQLQWTLYLEIF